MALPLSCLNSLNPFLNDSLPILIDEFDGNLFVFAIKRLCTLLLTAHNVFQIPILYDQVENAFSTTRLYMNMYRFMLIREEVKDKPKVFKILGISIIFGKYTEFFRNRQIKSMFFVLHLAQKRGLNGTALRLHQGFVSAWGKALPSAKTWRARCTVASSLLMKAIHCCSLSML